MTTTLTLEQIAEGLKGRIWEKNGMKRVYLDLGYTTKKMKTTTYVYEKREGEVGISCYIECSSQPMSWIRSQQDEVVDIVVKKIKNLENPEEDEDSEDSSEI